MSRQKPDIEQREEQILDAASDLITRLGYDKTSVNDIAEQVGLTRAIVYQHFESKDKLFEALLYREVQKYYETWLEHLETSNAGTIGGAFRSVLYAVHQSPFLSAMMKNDRRVFGSYVLRQGNLFAPIQASFGWEAAFEAMQQVGTVRQDLEPAVIAHIMTALALGLTTLQARADPEHQPSFDAILDTVATMVDGLLVSKDGGGRQAGKAVILRLAHAARSQFNRVQGSVHTQRS